MARRAPLLRLAWKAVVVITKPKSAEKTARLRESYVKLALEYERLDETLARRLSDL